MGAEHPPIGMHLIDHQILEVAQKVPPGIAEGADTRVDHIRVGDQDRRRVVPELFAQALGGVAVIDRGHLVHAAGKGQLIKGRELILAQGFQGKQKQSLGAGFRDQVLQDRQGVYQGLAAGRGGGDHQILALPGQVKGPGLVGVQLFYALGFEAFGDLPRQRRIGRGQGGLLSLDAFKVHHLAGQADVFAQGLYEAFQVP
jgi:hypothetical protein